MTDIRANKLKTSGITDHDFVMLENPKEDFYAIELKTGPYKGVRYIYGAVSIKETPELDTATMSFSYQISDNGSKFEDNELIENPEFKNYIGDILMYVIQDSLANKDGKIGHINTDTDSRTQPSD